MATEWSIEGTDIARALGRRLCLLSRAWAREAAEVKNRAHGGPCSRVMTEERDLGGWGRAAGGRTSGSLVAFSVVFSQSCTTSAALAPLNDRGELRSQ
jgi:hypothetical protein